MKKVISVVFLTASLCVIALAQDGKPPAGEAGESQVVLRVNGQEVTRAEFEKLLVQQKAREFMEEVIEGLLIEQAAKEAEVAVTDKEIEERQQEVFLQEMSYYDNDMAKLEEELKRYGYSIEERKKRNAHKTRLLLFVEKMIKKESVSEESLKRLFKERYSKNADRVAKVYHMLVSTEEKRRHIQQEITNLKLKSRGASAEQKLKIETQIAGLTEKLEKWKKFTSRSAVDEAVKRLREGADV